MARIRTIKPDFFRHEALYEAERETGLPLRVAFAGLWTAADREGRFHWKPRQLKLDCLPYDEVDFSRVLDALATRGFIARYAIEGREFGFIPSWHQHQIINNREKASEIPDPNEINRSTRSSREDDASSTPLSNFKGEGKGKEGERENIGGREEHGREAEPSPPGQLNRPRPTGTSKSLISEAAFEIASDVLIAMGLDPQHPVSVGAPLTVQSWLNGHWPREAILTGVKRGMLSRNGDPPGTLKYFEKAIARAHAELTAPVPVADLKPQGGFDVTATSRAKPETLSDVARRHAESGISFGPKPTGLPEPEGGSTVRMLSEG
jgi:hypothetical protein